MNKTQLVDHVVSSVNVTKKDAGILIDSVLDGIKKGMVEDGKVALFGFGTFSVVERKARTARNPQTGETIEVPAKMSPKFKPSKALKDEVEGVDVMPMADGGA